MPPLSRRRLLTATGASVSLFSAGPLIAGLGSIADEQLKPIPGMVQLRPEIEPLVRLIETTSRDRLMEEIGSKIRAGLSYREVLAALLLAGVRNVEPRPAVGFKFHAVLVVNSAHLASLASPSEDRWLPILWALDEFKSSQARDVSEGNWTMPPVDESRVSTVDRVRDVFHQSMTSWDEAQADVAAAGVARCLGAGEVLELFAAYAARDFRSIGHKAIYLANAWRTLQTIGWEHSEPVLRSLAYAILNHNGEPNPATNDLAPDRSWKKIQQIATTVRSGWESGTTDPAATSELLTVLRTGSADEAVTCVVDQLNRTIAPQSIYDALHLASGELLMRQTGIVALHAMTTTNAIRFLFDHVGSSETRKRLLLQNAAFLPQFRESMKSRGGVSDSPIDQLTALESTEPIALESIFDSIGRKPQQAAQQVMTYLSGQGDATTLMNAARRLVFLKGDDSHDYKFSSAILEDCLKVSPAHRPAFLAASSYYLKGSAADDNRLVNRIRSALT